MRIFYFLLLVSFCQIIFCQSKFDYTKYHIGYLGIDSHYRIDGGMGRLEVCFSKIKYNRFLMKYKFVGQIYDPLIGKQDCYKKFLGFHKKIAKDSQDIVFIGDKDTINYNISIKEKFDICICGYFKLFINFKNSQHSLFFYSPTYSILEVNFNLKPVR